MEHTSVGTPHIGKFVDNMETEGATSVNWEVENDARDIAWIDSLQLEVSVHKEGRVGAQQGETTHEVCIRPFSTS